MEITASMVNELRRATGSPMMDCKKALVESGADIDKAIQILRERGQAKAAKRIGNETSEGVIFSKLSTDKKVVSMVKVTCETEPVSKNTMFIELGEKVSEMVFNNQADLLQGTDIQAQVTEVRAKLGENVTIGESVRLSGDLTSFYIHSNKKVGVVIELILGDKSKNTNETLQNLAKDLCLQIASMSPKAVSTADLDPEFVKEEIAVIKGQLKEDPKNANKPDEILDKIVEGRKSKIFADACLLEQEFVKEKMFIKELVEKIAKEVGTTIVVKGFNRFQIGQ